MGGLTDEEIITMKCLVCKGSMEERVITLAEVRNVDGKEQYYIIKGVPAKVCCQCGETVYAPGVVDKLSDIGRKAKKGEKASQHVSVPVYSF